MSVDGCELKVAISYPCALRNGHEGACQPDPASQLRVYGIAVEQLPEIARDLYDARRLGLINSEGVPTLFGRYVRLRAGLDRIMPRAGGSGSVRVAEIERVLAEADSFVSAAPGRTL